MHIIIAYIDENVIIDKCQQGYRMLSEVFKCFDAKNFHIKKEAGKWLSDNGNLFTRLSSVCEMSENGRIKGKLFDAQN